MRVIAGTARSLPLKSVEGLETRPTTDRIKETLFNILQSDIAGARFLDLFSGSGAIGVEALSRGARQAVMIESSKKCVNCIKENLAFTHLSDKAVVMEQDVITALSRMPSKEVFDIIFIDAPYGQGYDKEVLRILRTAPFVDTYTMIIVEEAINTDFSYIDEDFGFCITKIKKYKTNKHVFLNAVL